jgi:hypothetical protein
VLCAILNIPQPPTSFNIYDRTASSALTEVSEYSMMQTARWTVTQNEEDDLSDITACFDGSWQKCGHTSLHGIISATSSDKEEVLHIEIMKKFCFVCYTNPTIGHKCKKNFERTGGGTEVACVLDILVVLFISEVFVTQSILVLGSTVYK